MTTNERGSITMNEAIRHAHHAVVLPWWGWLIVGVVFVLAVIGRVRSRRRR